MHLEHQIEEGNTRVHLLLAIARDERCICQIPRKSHRRRHVQRSHSSVEQSRAQEDTRAAGESLIGRRLDGDWLQSPLTTTSHTQPVYSASIQGTANANNLITVSSDGKMCAWNVEMLQEPQVRLSTVTSSRYTYCRRRSISPGA